jgi:hypothetical protein
MDVLGIGLAMQGRAPQRGAHSEGESQSDGRCRADGRGEHAPTAPCKTADGFTQRPQTESLVCVSGWTEDQIESRESIIAT